MYSPVVIFSIVLCLTIWAWQVWPKSIKVDDAMVDEQN